MDKFLDTFDGKEGIQFLRTQEDFIFRGETHGNCVGSQWNCWEMENCLFFDVHLKDEIVTVGWDQKRRHLIGDQGIENNSASSAIKKFYQEYLMSQGLL